VNVWVSVLPQLAVISVILWVVATPKDRWDPASEEKTRKNLKLAERIIIQAKQNWDTVPGSLVEIKALAKISKINFSSFDGYGQPLQYIKLSNDHYVLRSFGRDGQQNTLFNELDPNIKTWIPSYGSTPLYRYQKSFSALTLYPSPLILGSISPNLQWYAQIYVDQYSGRRQLLIRRQNSPLFLIAPHDHIEEFLWLPDSHKIIFTATQSQRYKDGVYLWDLMTDKIVNLLSSHNAKNDLFASNPLGLYYMSLAGANINGDEYYLYIAPRNNLGLDPAEFFSTKYLHRIKVNSLPDDILVQQFPHDAVESLFKKPILIMGQLYGQKEDDKVFRDWSSLSLTGDLQSTLESWQRFSQENASSTIIPYCLWFLASMYHDSSKAMKASSAQDAEILRSYGAELALGLSRLISPPSYLQAFGHHIYETLTSGGELSYQISDLGVGKKK